MTFTIPIEFPSRRDAERWINDLEQCVPAASRILARKMRAVVGPTYAKGTVAWIMVTVRSAARLLGEWDGQKWITEVNKYGSIGYEPEGVISAEVIFVPPIEGGKMPNDN